jgi:hypothetical protein
VKFTTEPLLLTVQAATVSWLLLSFHLWREMYSQPE